jgi:tellurite resistance protein TerC
LEVVVDPYLWSTYHVIVAAFIAIDLFVGRRRRHGLTLKEATFWTAVWIGVGLTFGLLILMQFGLEPSAKYYAVYVLEKTLSMDNLFVFAIIFMYFGVPAVAQPVVLYVGVISAIILRAAFIYGGLLLLEIFHWMVFVFGAVLIYSGIRIWRGAAERVKVEHNPLVNWARRILPITDHYDGTKFIVRTSTKLMFTPLIVVLVAIESTDILFAIDSVPAAIALVETMASPSLKFFVAYTGNISAILGLRALYFLIALTMFKFRYIGKGLAFILAFLGIKFFLSGVDLAIPTFLSIIIVFSVLAIAIVASILAKKEHEDSVA